MPKAKEKLRRWRPRFTVRALLIVLTLACAFLACWEPTKVKGLRDVRSHLAKTRYYGWYFVANETAICPMIIQTDEPGKLFDGFLLRTEPHTRRYYVWFFGYITKLPLEWELPPSRQRPAIEF